MARHGRTGAWRRTGEELAALRASVIEADQVLPLLRTDQLTAALVTVNAAMDKIEALARSNFAHESAWRTTDERITA